MAFKYCFPFATVLAANFGCDRFRIMPEIVFKLLRTAIWSGCAVPLESEQTPCSQTDPRFRSAALHIWSNSLFLFRDSRMIERLSEAMSAALVCMTRYQGLATSIENFISNGIRITARNSQSIETFLTLDSRQYRKNGSTFSSGEI